MQSYSINIVIFSELLSHGGGRETWLNNFLPFVFREKLVSEVNVYYISESGRKDEARISAFFACPVNFIPVRLPGSAGKTSGLRRIFGFLTAVIVDSFKRNSSRNVYVAVGSYYETIALCLIRLFGVNRPLFIAWLRGVLIKEISHRKARVVLGLLSRLEQAALKRMDVIIANGWDTREYYQGLLAREVFVIPNAVNLNAYSSIAREAFSNRCVKVSYIGRLSLEKGILDYLKAIDIFVAQGGASNVSFEVVGDGPLRGEVEDFARRYDEGTFRYIGVVPNHEMIRYMASIDVGVNLTYSGDTGGAGVSNSYLELIASRRLCISWDSHIFKQVLKSGQSVYVPEADVQSLANAFSRLDHDRSEMRAMIESSSVAISKYGFESHVSNFFNLLYKFRPVAN